MRGTWSTKMQEVQYSDLKVGETYYIELLGPFVSDIPRDFKTKRKGTVYRKDHTIDELSGAHIPWVQFDQFTGLNTTEISHMSLCIVFDGGSDTKFYLPQRDMILARKEKEMVNTVCSYLAGDPTLVFY
jgi:hypothetical protein